ncbi:uncharacterized protein P174DRAFT_442476 [Aspergillus novofumigatus IBT 16806]|uniref:F-box domain protein n=1 Tax=Aspergillus novofumigatus (strain IBT 16806) TaxID=1392255 RepID=A0A2I1C4V1_ASPN1|nr:uncharacterized protein P174DRAFT_442476 [Aspergillus novofumigatus IBT 16806]PKX92621.1 hypothetical protein P174DRAFT_442476 [Aspergillus novofumigatus IBT 16806]
MSAESPGQKTGFRAFLTNALRPKKSRQVLRKNTVSTPNLRAAARPSIASDEVPELGETRDPTAMLHSIGILDTEDSDGFASDLQKDNRPPGEPMIASLSQDLWALVAEYLNPAERASLAFASKTLLLRLGRGPWMALNLPENREYRVDFLAPHDRYLPHHLLCMPCARYHRRTQEGHERLEPATVLALRAHRFGPAYGIPVDSLSRRWRRDGWSHHTRYHIHKGKLLMRVVSSTFAEPDLAPSSMRLLLYSRDDYWPYFSVCAHWRDGQLMDVCKCALGHVPKPRATAGLQGLEHRAKDIYHGRTHNPNQFATLCAKCRPMRRCPDCPSEYMVEIKLSEDRSDPRSLRFRHAIVVTRWCDLGDGTSPHGSREWAACNGELAGYDSFEVLGKRSISGVFESAFTDDHIPGQRIVSMNPKGKRLGEAGNSWY